MTLTPKYALENFSISCSPIFVKLGPLFWTFDELSSNPTALNWIFKIPINAIGNRQFLLQKDKENEAWHCVVFMYSLKCAKCTSFCWMINLLNKTIYEDIYESKEFNFNIFNRNLKLG